MNFPSCPTILALVTVSLGLAGCASKSELYSVRPLDAPVCMYKPGKALLTLDTGQSCYAHVIAKERISLTPVRVDACETYEISVPPGQVWDDKGRINRPPHGEDGSFLMNLFKRYKRIQGAQWFALMGTAVDIELPKTSVPHFNQDLSVCPKLAIERPGQLGFYPNDAIAPWGDGNTFYDNNGGEIWVKVTRTADACQKPARTAATSGANK
jgi:hypothetical protein